MSSASVKRELLMELHEVFDAWPIEDLRKSMQDWFAAAMTHKYSWKHGSPGNLLYLHDQVLKLFVTSHELLRIVRAFYPHLLKKQMSLKTFLLIAQKQKQLSALPIYLTWDEITAPYQTLQRHLGVDGIVELKKNLHLLLEMGLSNQTLVDEDDEHPEKVFPIFLGMIKLVEAINDVRLSETKKQKLKRSF